MRVVARLLVALLLVGLPAASLAPAAAQPTFDTGVLTEPPQFYDPASDDYRPDKPAGSPLIDLAGSDAPRYGRLLNGQTQTAGGWDAGALESNGAELLRAGAEAQGRLHEVETPFLVVHGTADPLASPVWSKRLYERAAAPDKTLRFYDGLYYETFNEPERDQVLDDLTTWLGERMPTDSSP